jgi:hypothetical protein
MAFRPTTVNILGKSYAITYCDRPSDVDLYGRQSLWGQCDYWSRTIRIYDNGRNDADVLQGLLHECLHAIDSELGLGLKKDEDVDRLAMALGDLLSRNGWLATKRPEHDED